MRVKWGKFIDVPEIYWNENNAQNEYIEYEGEIIGTSRTLFGNQYLIIACSDGKIREVIIESVKLI